MKRKDKTIALVGPHHDPSGKLISGMRNRMATLRSIFDVVAISVSESTDSRVLKEFDLAGIHFEIRVEDGSVSKRYRDSLKLGLEDNVDHMVLIDFDRALHWVNSFPEELETVAHQLRDLDGFTSLVRSNRAFETHPPSQRETEKVVNQIASEVIGKKVDPMSGGYAMDTETAAMLEKKATNHDFSFYGQLLAVTHQEGIQINSVEVEGLEWETPDQFKDEINKLGYMDWLNNFQSLDEWEKRLTLAFEAGSVFKL